MACGFAGLAACLLTLLVKMKSQPFRQASFALRLGIVRPIHGAHPYALANKFLTLLSNVFTNLNLTDMEVCYKVFRREVIQGIQLKSDRFGFEPEVTAKVARFTFPARDGQPGRNCRIYEIPVSYNGRDYSEGKKIGIKDGFQALYCIVRYAFRD